MAHHLQKSQFLLFWRLSSAFALDGKGNAIKTSAVGIQKDLTALYLLLLNNARKRSGFEFVSSHPAFNDALSAWMSSALEDSTERAIIVQSELRQLQGIYAPSGKRLEVVNQPVTVIGFRGVCY